MYCLLFLGSLILTKTISSEECIVKAPEPIKKAILPDVSSISGPEILPIKRTEVPLSDFKPISAEKETLPPKKTDITSSDFKPFCSDKEMLELKESIQSLKTTIVTRNEFNELSKQVIYLIFFYIIYLTVIKF